ncbi:MAG TPA: CBS domain-containing protein [bacterium]|nr:CBS domain-containing protein [bacterium]
MRARELMSTPVVTIYPDASLKDLAEVMVTHRVSGVPVVDRAGMLLGVVSESDVMAKIEGAIAEQTEVGVPRLITALAKALNSTPKSKARSVANLMTTRVVSAGPDATVQELVHLMIAYDINRIPIVEAGRLLGIVTRADVLRTFVRPDAAIETDLRWRIAHELWISPEALKISCRNGIVTLAGTVETHADAELVRRWAAKIEGVVGVEDRDLRYAVDERRIPVRTDSLR